MALLYNNEKTVSMLKESIDGNLSHAYIFSGAKGSGKHTLCNYFASAILCLGDERPCGKCRACQMLKSSNHPDIIKVSPGGAAGMIKIDAVRELRKTCYIKPIVGKHRVIVIEDAECMNVQAQNALLKIFEEPPEGNVFILLTNRLVRLLPTIRSRAAIITMSLCTKEQTLQAVTPQKRLGDTVSPENAAAYCDGVVGEALELMHGDANSPYNIACELAPMISGGYAYDILRYRERITKNRETLCGVCEALVKFFGDVCLCMAGDTSKLHFNIEKVETAAQKLTNARVLNIIEVLQSVLVSAETTEVDLRMLGTNMLLQCFSKAHE